MGISAGGNVTAGRDIVAIDGDSNTVGDKDHTTEKETVPDQDTVNDIAELKGLIAALSLQVQEKESGMGGDVVEMIQRSIESALAAKAAGEPVNPYVTGVKGLVDMVSQLRKDVTPIVGNITSLLSKIMGN